MKVLVLIPWVCHVDVTEECSPKEAGFPLWKRCWWALVHSNAQVTRKVATRKINIGLKCFIDIGNDVNKIPKEFENIRVPVEVDGIEKFFFLTVKSVCTSWNPRLPAVIRASFDVGLSRDDIRFLAGRTHNEKGIFSRNVMNDVDRSVGNVMVYMAEVDQLIDAWKLATHCRLKGLAPWRKEKLIPVA